MSVTSLSPCFPWFWPRLGVSGFSTLGRREGVCAHLCHLHLDGELTFHFHARAQTEGLQRTICMPIYITEYWIVTCCVLILWIIILFFFLKLNIFYCWTAGTKCRVSLHSLEQPHQPWSKMGGGEHPADTSLHPHHLRRGGRGLGTAFLRN